MTTQSNIITVLIQFTSDWHIGTGGGIPGISDQSLLRDAKGFPFIPGRTLRGILRETHREFAQLTPFRQGNLFTLEEIWGTSHLTDSDETSQQGRWVISNGELNITPETRESLESAPAAIRKTWLNEISFNTSRISLDPRRRTREDHLAFIELGRKGLEFQFTVAPKQGNMSEDEKKILRLLLLGTQRLGGFRRRGKGRVRMYLKEDNDRRTMRNKVKEENNVQN